MSVWSGCQGVSQCHRILETASLSSQEETRDSPLLDVATAPTTPSCSLS